MLWEVKLIDIYVKAPFYFWDEYYDLWLFGCPIMAVQIGFSKMFTQAEKRCWPIQLASFYCPQGF